MKLAKTTDKGPVHGFYTSIVGIGLIVWLSLVLAPLAQASAGSFGVDDIDRVGVQQSLGKIWIRSERADDLEQICNAVYVRESIWVTSQHCFPEGGATYFLAQPERTWDEIAQVEIVSNDRDLAFFQTLHRKEGKPLSAPSHFPSKGEKLSLVAFNGEGSSKLRVVPLELVGRIDRLRTTEGWTFRDLIVTVSVTQRSTCRGDSGAPILSGDQLVGLHTAGESGNQCDIGSGKYSAESYIHFNSAEIQEVLSRFTHADDETDSFSSLAVCPLACLE
ncbi:trypsin-like serine protease [Corynebacterium liangguodongii]|uniref:Uncharacterized protein n=1 Tax=Corynebacterium liangguodongii TaxID=2079535 RepID=A0A2S0WCZ3_9CORY|nr:trypsin-like serine protease [Corynebacterium liangguodongii]AWB83639.1 hypothetical protein C3E79_03345 [Corynebacterium liangguodongii]PWB99552.1 hypothetical protein DF219_06450 [Corynebacterium liangguodongii]